MLCLGIGLTIDGLRRVGAPRAAIAGLTALLALQPAVQAVSLDLDRRRVGTEELMARWIEANIPPSDKIAIESPRLRLRPRPGKVEYITRFISMPIERYRQEGFAYLVTSSAMEDVFFNNPQVYPAQVNAYKQLFASTQLIHAVQPSSDRPGPALSVLKIP
jgi:hypothetical protein